MDGRKKMAHGGEKVVENDGENVVENFYKLFYKIPVLRGQDGTSGIGNQRHQKFRRKCCRKVGCRGSLIENGVWSKYAVGYW